MNAYLSVKYAYNWITVKSCLLGLYNRLSLTQTRGVNIRFATDIYPYLSELEKNFTKYRLANIVQLTSVYAVRLYELLICWLGQGLHNKEFDIDDFRRLMGVDDKYSQFGQLKDRVITPALEQINEFTDHEIRVSYRKVGQYSASLLSVSTLRTLNNRR